MIPADDITPTDVDGRMWWRTDFMAALLDRPCDTCGGRKTIDLGWRGHPTVIEKCTDCDGTGRHTFEVEWEAPEVVDGATELHVHRHRVHVAPGMVLPVVDEQDAMDGGTIPAACILYRTTTGESWFWGRPQDGVRPITLPPTTKPGDWLVRLQAVPR